MARFDQISIGEIFFDGQTDEYYIKKTDMSGCIYDIAEDHESLDADFQPMQRAFTAGHQVEDI